MPSRLIRPPSTLARLLGPPAAAFVIARYGEGLCFAIDGASYLAVIASLLMMRIAYTRSTTAHLTSAAEQLRDGFAYVSSFIPVRNILLLFATTSLLGMSQMALMPIFAAQVLHGGPRTLGVLTTASATGALISAFALAARKSVIGPAEEDPDRVVSLWRRHRRLRPLTLVATLPHLHGSHRLRHDAGSCLQQHHHPDACTGREAWTRDELLHHGFHRYDTVRAACLQARWAAASEQPHTLVLCGIIVILAATLFTIESGKVRAMMRPRYEELGILAPKA